MERQQIMFVRTLQVEKVDADGRTHPCPIRQLDNFSMRNFTNDAIFDDTLPVRDGLLEAGYRVPLERLQEAMESWFRRKGYLANEEILRVTEIDPARPLEELKGLPLRPSSSYGL